MVPGGVIGFALLAAWNHQRNRPPLEGAVATTGAVIGFLGVCAVAAAAVLPQAKLHPIQVTAGLIPLEQLPATDEDARNRWTDLLTAYPQDPRAHAIAAEVWVKNGGNSEAERELQTALASPLLHAPEVQPSLEQRLRVMLVGVQARQGNIEGARRSAAALCPTRSSLEPRLQKALDQMKACDGR
jgi:hypothetical protein